jgi:hypothetical protein
MWQEVGVNGLSTLSAWKNPTRLDNAAKMGHE